MSAFILLILRLSNVTVSEGVLLQAKICCEGHRGSHIDNPSLSFAFPGNVYVFRQPQKVSLHTHGDTEWEL